MPIKITDFNWSQREISVFIKFGLKNCNPKNLDIVCTSSYLKVNFNPYIFEAFLCHKIDPEQTSCIIKEGDLHFHLTKASSDNWETFEINPTNKEAAQTLRAEALKEFEELEREKDKKKKESKISLEWLAVSRQISWNAEKQLQQKELLRQEQLKFFSDNNFVNSETSKENRKRLSSLCSEDGSVIVSEGGYDGDEESVNFSSSENLPSMLKNNLVVRDELIGKKTKGVKKTASPGIRQGCLIKMHHTPHEPSIPKRESLTSSCQEEETTNTNEMENAEDEAKSKERETLKCEAIKCFGCRNYDAAVKAYTNLIDLYPSQPTNYSNRAAAFIALNSYEEAVRDCSKALEFLCPPTKENAKSRLLCHVRRGTSYVRLRDLSAGLRDFEAAFRLDPNNVSLAKDAAVIRASLNAYADIGEDTSDSQRSSEEESECQIDLGKGK